MKRWLAVFATGLTLMALIPATAMAGSNGGGNAKGHQAANKVSGCFQTGNKHGHEVFITISAAAVPAMVARGQTGDCVAAPGTLVNWRGWG